MNIHLSIQHISYGYDTQSCEIKNNVKKHRTSSVVSFCKNEYIPFSFLSRNVCLKIFVQVLIEYYIIICILHLEINCIVRDFVFDSITIFKTVKTSHQREYGVKTLR